MLNVKIIWDFFVVSIFVMESTFCFSTNLPTLQNHSFTHANQKTSNRSRIGRKNIIFLKSFDRCFPEKYEPTA